jgi:hypothetical protein
MKKKEILLLVTVVVLLSAMAVISVHILKTSLFELAKQGLYYFYTVK